MKAEEFNYVDFIREKGKLDISLEDGELHVSRTIRMRDQKIIIRDIYVAKDGAVVLDRTEHGEVMGSGISWEQIDQQGIRID